MFTLSVFLIFCNFLAISKGQYASDYPSPMPLVIKSPYFNSWIPTDANLTTPGGRLPFFYTGSNTSWSGYIRVDGAGFNFQGFNPNYTTAQTLGQYITPTRTIFTIDAGPIRLNMTYLSPIEPSNWKLHSLPFAYMAINAWSTDSQPHNVQIYSDVSGQFLSANWTDEITWNTTYTSSGKSIYHRVQRRSMGPLTEHNGMSEDGVLYFATTVATDLTWRSGGSITAGSGFLAEGKLNKTQSTEFRAISSNTPVMSFALDLGNITSTVPIVFALGLVRNPVLTYLRGGNVHNRIPLWMNQWSSIDTAIDDFLSNYPAALNRAIALDTKIMTDATNTPLSSSTSALYQNLVALNLRQTMGALEFTTSTLANGSLAGTSDLRVFMKDVGTSLRVNPVETIYAAFPMFLYLSPTLAGSLLEPLLEFQSTSSSYPYKFAAPDLGSSWPQVKGNNSDQSVYAVENCGSMVVMALAHAQKSGDGSLIHRYYGLLKSWTDLLVSNGLYPNGSLTSDNLAETSNLAVKSIMGIYAMGNINKILEARGADPTKSKYYIDTATSYAKQWETLAYSYDHITSTYGNGGSWGFIYNLYLPKLLGAGIFSQNIYDAQASWYASKLAPTDSFGIGFDSNDPNTAKGHWLHLTAGSVYNTSVSAGRNALIKKAEARPYFKSTNNKANPSTYAADQGTTISGISSPALGASFSILALSVPDQSSITLPIGVVLDNTAHGSNSSKRNKILGATLGSIAGIIFVGIIIFFIRRRRAPQHSEDKEIEKALSEVGESPGTATMVVPLNAGSGKPSILMTYEGSNPSATFPSTEPDAQGGESSTPNQQQEQQQARLVSQRSNLHVTNRAPDDEKLSVPNTPRLEPQRRQTEEQDQVLRREVEQLRMEIDAIRVGQQLQHEPRRSEDPPPGYVES